LVTGAVEGATVGLPLVEPPVVVVEPPPLVAEVEVVAMVAVDAALVVGKG